MWSEVKWKWKSLSRVWLFATPWTIQPMEFSKPEYWSGLPFPSPGDIPNPGIKHRSPALQADSLPAEPQGSPRVLEWVAYPFSSGSSRPRNGTRVSCIAGIFFTKWAAREAQVKVTLSCLTFCNPMDYTVRGILQARILEQVAFPFSRGSSQCRDQTQVSHVAGGFFTRWATREHPWAHLKRGGNHSSLPNRWGRERA